jgi:hypothetical protein
MDDSVASAEEFKVDAWVLLGRLAVVALRTMRVISGDWRQRYVVKVERTQSKMFGAGDENRTRVLSLGS